MRFLNHMRCLTVVFTFLFLVGGLFGVHSVKGQCNDTLEANFSASTPVCMFDSVDFVNLGTDSHKNFTYEWDFGSDADPAKSSVEDPQNITYSSAGVKSVTLTITDTSCSPNEIVSETKGITIYEEPNADFSLSSTDTCQGTEVDFTNTGSSGDKWNYQWDFGEDADPNTSSAENPKGIVYSSPGQKTVTFTVSNDNCSDTYTATFMVNDDPEASFSSTAPTCEGDTMSFDNTGSSGGSWSYDWDFGSDASPSTSTDENPQGISYSKEGNKTVQFVIHDASCSDTAWNTITINDQPTATFTSNAPVCVQSEVDFTNTGSSGDKWSYTWDFGKGASPSTSTAENPSGVTYSSAGKKVVTLTISDGKCTATDTQHILIEQTPSASFTSTAPTCTGDTMSFTYTGSMRGNNDYQWSFGNGSSPSTSSKTHPSGIKYDTKGTKTVDLEVRNTNTGCVDTVDKTITINFTPKVSFDATDSVCAKSPVDFENTGTSADKWSYSWSFGASARPANSTAENPSDVSYRYGGTKIVTFSITDGTCTNTDTGLVSIDTLPDAYAGADTTICAERTVQLGTSPVSGYSYRWKPASTLDDSSKANPIASPEASFTNYKLRVTDNTTGCKGKDTVVVTMLNSMMADAGPDRQICYGDTVQIGTAPLEGQTYRWRVDSMPSDTSHYISDTTNATPYVAPGKTTEYTVFVTDTSASRCDAITDEITVTVHPLPAADAGPDSVEITRGMEYQLLATGGIQYLWSPLQGLSNASIQEPIAQPDSSRTYTVEVTDVNGCVNEDSIHIEVNKPRFFVPSAFTPNDDGKNDVFKVRSRGFEKFKLVIFNKWGEKLFQTTNPNKGWDGRKASTNQKLPEGAYVYLIQGELTNGDPIEKKGMVNLIR